MQFNQFQQYVCIGLMLWLTAPAVLLADHSATWNASHGSRDLHSLATAAATITPDPDRLGDFPRTNGADTDWGGPNCPTAMELRALVDTYLATPHPNFPGLGSTVPGVSVSWSSQDCGIFTYAAGWRNIENREPLTPETLMGIASMTKPIIAALTLMLNDMGVFGPAGLDTPVDQLLTPGQIQALTVGDDPSHPRCPGTAFLRNRETGEFEPTTFSCPDLSAVNLRHLMVSNHGMYDYTSEVQLSADRSQHGDSMYFELFEALGLNPIPPVSSDNGFDYLKAFGLKRNPRAVIGGNLFHRDMEKSLGNTGFQLLGVILEHQTGQTLDELIRTHIVAPLGTDPIFVYLDPDDPDHLIANGYDMYTGSPIIDFLEDTGIYPRVAFNGHVGINTNSLGLGLPANLHLAGGSGSLVDNPRSHRAFMDAFINGDLLGPAAKAELENSFVVMPDRSTPGQIEFSNGFGVSKRTTTNMPGFIDASIIFHGGSLPGIRCQDPVIRRPNPAIAPVTGVLCTNVRELAHPDPLELMLQFIIKIAEANP